jgi:hypothetical protein
VARVDWDPRLFERSSLFGAIAEAAERLAGFASFPSPAELDAALSPYAGVRFVPQAPRPRRARRTPKDPSAMYDARIARDGEVPTRPGSWHDLMNALVWATFPLAKRALHARQHRLVTPGAPRRTRTLDALALLDEGSVLVAVPSEGPLPPDELRDEAAIRDALAAGHATLAVFGHAIYEGVALGWPLPIASAVVLRTGTSRDLDAALASWLEDLNDPRTLLRLPLQGLDRIGSATRVRAPRGPSASAGP